MAGDFRPRIQHYRDVRGPSQALRPLRRRIPLVYGRDFTRLLLIHRMKPLGFTLEAMADLLRVIDALETPEPGEDDIDIRSELNRFIEEAAKRRAKSAREEAHAAFPDFRASRA